MVPLSGAKAGIVGMHSRSFAPGTPLAFESTPHGAERRASPYGGPNSLQDRSSAQLLDRTPVSPPLPRRRDSFRSPPIAIRRRCRATFGGPYLLRLLTRYRSPTLRYCAIVPQRGSLDVAPAPLGLAEHRGRLWRTPPRGGVSCPHLRPGCPHRPRVPRRRGPGPQRCWRPSPDSLTCGMEQELPRVWVK